MAANGIDESHRDDFVRHAVKFDDDDNQYLKKAEIEAAAAAWGSADESADSEEEEAAEETEAADESDLKNQKRLLQKRKQQQKMPLPKKQKQQKKQLLKRLQLKSQAQKIARFVVTQTLKEQSPANLVDLHSDYRGYSQRGQAWSRVSSDTMMMTIRGKVRSISSRSCTAGGITPTLISTASHASGYCLSHASTSAIIPSGGTPGLTLAR